MKKYFMAGTDEEVFMGDVVSVELEKDFGDGRKLSRELELKITEATVDDAVELGILDVKDTKKKTIKIKRANEGTYLKCKQRS